MGQRISLAILDVPSLMNYMNRNNEEHNEADNKHEEQEDTQG